MIHPCRECIVFVNCSKLCDKVVLGSSEITPLVLEHKRCIDCGGSKCLEYPSIKKGWHYLLCTSCNSVYTMVVEATCEFERHAKFNGPVPSIVNGSVFDGTKTTFIDFLVRRIGAHMGEGWHGISL